MYRKNYHCASIIQLLGKERFIVTLLLFAFFAQIFLGARLFSVAMDEQVHLPTGFVHLETKEAEFRKSNAPFVGILVALPSFLFSKPDINTKDPDISSNNFWDFGNKFLFTNDAEKLVFSGRMVVAFLSLLMAFYVFRWAKELFGQKAGLLALFLFVFIPLVVGHSQLISTDIGLAVFFFISSYYFWKSLKEQKLEHKVLSGLFLGMALASKFSGMLLVPLFILLTFIKVRPWISKKAMLTGRQVEPWFKLILPVFAFGFLALWAIYFFPTDPNFYSNGFRSIYAEDANPNYLVYLNGEFKIGGWWYYFLEGFAIKTPIPFLVFLVWALFLFKKLKTTFLNKMFLLAPPAVLFFFTSFGAHNLGTRYLIPAYPFLAVYAGGIINHTNKKAAIIFLASLSVWYVFFAVNSHPDQLAYFNEFVGGSDNGYKYMDDSNIDWGQDLKRLKKFTDANPDAKVVYIWRQGDRALDYYGTGKEKNIIDLPENWWSEPKGKYAVSSHFLVRAKIMSQVYSEPSLDWASLYKPADRIGQSFFIYEF